MKYRSITYNKNYFYTSLVEISFNNNFVFIQTTFGEILLTVYNTRNQFLLT